MRLPLLRLSAVLLLSVTALALLSPERATPYTRLRAAYADRFTPRGAYISWSAPIMLPALVPYSDLIIYGVVERESYKLASVLGSLERSVYEIRVIECLKKPEGPLRDPVLVSQVTEEAWNPALQPGDLCVFFLHLSEHDAPSSTPLYYLSGVNSRYVVYRGSVYSLSSLKPQAPLDQYQQESLPAFITRIQSFTPEGAP